jgi:hypothetical protein
MIEHKQLEEHTFAFDYNYLLDGTESGVNLVRKALNTLNIHGFLEKK